MLMKNRVPHQLQSYICSGDIWKKWNEQSSTYQYVYLFGDLHLGNRNLNNEHRTKFLDLVSFFDKDETLVIIEDSTEYMGENEGVAKLTSLLKRSSALPILEFMSTECKEIGYHVFNAECRHSRLFSEAILEVYYTFQKDDNSVRMDEVNNSLLNSDLLPKTIAQECVQYLDEIAQYDDCLILNNYYYREINRLKSLISTSLSKMENFDGDFASFINTFSNSIARNREFIYRLGLWGSELLNMRVLHEIYTNSHKKNFLVLMGEGHICDINTQLSKLGYERLYNDSRVEFDPNLINFEKEVISNIDIVLDSSVSIDELQVQTKKVDEFNRKLLELNTPVSALFWDEVEKHANS